MRTLTDGQKRKVLLSMIYENDNKFIGQLNYWYAKKENKRYQDHAVAIPLATNFLKKNYKSWAAFCDIHARGQNWLNFMTDVELLHYLDYQNRMLPEVRKAKDTKSFFNILAANKVGFNEYYSTSADCPKLERKLQVPESEKLPNSVLKDPELRNSVILEVMLKAHNAKMGTKDKVISRDIAEKFKLSVQVPTITEQVKGGLPTPEYDDDEPYSVHDILPKDARPVSIVYGEPVYEIEDPSSETGVRYVTSTGEDYTAYYYAGERDREYEDD